MKENTNFRKVNNFYDLVSVERCDYTETGFMRDNFASIVVVNVVAKNITNATFSPRSYIIHLVKI